MVTWTTYVHVTMYYNIKLYTCLVFSTCIPSETEKVNFNLYVLALCSLATLTSEINCILEIELPLL